MFICMSTNVSKLFCYEESEVFFKGYVEATVIPRNARNIRVEEVTGVDNYLALQNDNGEYYLNGHWFIQWTGDYNIAGTVVRYNRLGNRDSFDAAGPITEPLHIMVVQLRLLKFTHFC